MCIEIVNNNINMNMEKNNNHKNTKKISYTIKKALQKIFKKEQLKTNEAQKIINENLLNSEKAESLESLENLRNADIEQENISLESYENEANERISISHQTISHEIEDYDLSELPTVPVHFVRTEHGTFFWTATSNISADNDLIEPLYCSTSNQIAIHQMQDRWAQA